MVSLSDHEVHIVGAGFGRTGTTSLKLALDQLGFKCYHVVETFSSLSDWEKWYDISKLSAEERKNWNWDKIYEPRNYTAALDAPTSDYWEEICDFYNKKKQKKDYAKDNPLRRVKVILTLRDTPETWHQSMLNTIIPISEQSNRWFSRLLNSKFVDSIYAIHWNGTLEGKHKDKDFAIQKYLERIEYVKKKVPKEDLLIYNAKQGWEPLCQFLHKDVPIDHETGSVIPFPAANSTEDFRKRILFIKAINDIATFAVVALTVGAVFYLKRKLKK